MNFLLTFYLPNISKEYRIDGEESHELSMT